MEGIVSPGEHGEKDMEGQGSSDIDEEDVAKAVQVGRNEDDEDGSCAMGESGCFLAVLPSHSGGHLGVNFTTVFPIPEECFVSNACNKQKPRIRTALAQSKTFL